jgi:uncharacterized membrane protein YfcA
LIGSILGARLLAAARGPWLRRIFMWVIVAVAFEMIYTGVTGKL